VIGGHWSEGKDQEDQEDQDGTTIQIRSIEEGITNTQTQYSISIINQNSKTNFNFHLPNMQIFLC